jgi:hypothetical protein
MTQKIDKISINNELLDRRVKLTQEDKKEIKRMYLVDGFSIRQLAVFWNVSKRSIQFAIYPERAKRVVELHDSSKYYDKDKHKLYMRKHREYKKKLLKEGKIK